MFEGATTPWHSDEHIEQYDSLFPILPHYAAHYTIGGGRLPEIGLPDKHALELAGDIISVLAAHRLEVSIPWAKKRYVKESDTCPWLGLTDRIDHIFSKGESCLEAYVSFGLTFNKKADSYEDLSVQFFYRNMAALGAAKRLSELGYLCEVAAILRMAMEQFAFSGALWSLPVSKSIKTFKPKQSLGHLKHFVPASRRLYGLLSKYTHFEYDHHTHFFEISPKKTVTVRWDSVLRAYATHLIFLTMVCIGRYTLAISKNHFGEVPASVSGLDAFIRDVYAYSDDVCTVLQLDAVLAELDRLLADLIKL